MQVRQLKKLQELHLCSFGSMSESECKPVALSVSSKHSSVQPEGKVAS